MVEQKKLRWARCPVLEVVVFFVFLAYSIGRDIVFQTFVRAPTVLFLNFLVTETGNSMGTKSENIDPDFSIWLSAES